MPQPSHRRTEPLRRRLVLQLRRQLERDSYPRLQMMLLVALTGAAGFLCSTLLLHSGMDEMGLRYLISVGCAYLVFLVLLWLWLRTSADDYDSVPDAVDWSNALPSPHQHGWTGGGGRFGGGGAQGRWESTPVEYERSESIAPFDSVDVDGADEFAIPLVVLIFAVTLVLASFSIVYSAPVLFAELLLDGVLAATLYRGLKRLETRHWLETALRRTLLPFIVAAVLLAAAGWGMQVYAPGAHSLGEVIATRAVRD